MNDRTLSWKVILVGDSHGVRALLDAVPARSVALIVGGSRRADDLQQLRALAALTSIPLAVQPPRDSVEMELFLERIRSSGAVALFCFSYSMKIQRDVIQFVRGNAYNVHYSLLPKNRGPNPLQWAIIRDELETGVTLHKLAESFDTGDIVHQTRIAIEDADTWVTLHEKIGRLLPSFLRTAVEIADRAEVTAIAQSEQEATLNLRLTPEFPRIEFDRMTNRQIFNLIRAQVAPLKGAFVEIAGARTYFPAWMSMPEVEALRQKYKSSLVQT